jgi:hypothetical protein
MFAIPLSLAAADTAAKQQETLRGRLTRTPNDQPALETPQHETIALDGDESTLSVLNDERLRGMDLELIGHFTSPRRFLVDPFHTRAMFVHKDGKRLIITYWCNVCYLRTYTPGKCWCCQKYTDLDLRENDDDN